MRYLRHPIFIRPIFILLALVLTSAYLRINNIGHGSSFHPDERHIVMTLEKMSWQNLNPGFFAYGSFPFYTAFFVADLLMRVDRWYGSYDGMFILGRYIAVFFGVLTVALTWLLAKMVFKSSRIAVAAALLLSFNVLHIQLSRFFAFDGILTALCTAVIISSLLILRGNRRWGYPLTAIFWGLALATKISALSLGVPIALALFFAGEITVKRIFLWIPLQLCLLTVGAILIFACAEPYAFIDFTLFKLQNLEQINMTRGEWRPPYTIQYWNTTPFIYSLEQMARWSFWWPAFVAAMVGVIGTVFAKNREHGRERWILFSWVMVSYLSIAGLQVKFPRYLLTIYPTLCILAAWGIEFVAAWVKTRQRTVATFLYALVLIPSAIFAYAFRGIYDKEHSYPAASLWIYDNVPRGSIITGFHWDDKIPLTLPGLEPRNYDYTVDEPELKIYELPDNLPKIRELCNDLEMANYLAWPTQRIPGSLPRVPEEFSRSLRLLQMLYTGELGFELVYTYKVRPTFLGYEWRNDSLDESFSVYDHPKVMVFKKTKPIKAGEMISMIESSLYSGAPAFTREEFLEVDQHAGQPRKKSTVPADDSPFSLIIWFILLEAIAFIAWPFLAVLLPHSLDRGYLLSKTFGVLLFGMTAWLLAISGSIKLTTTGLCVVLALLTLSSLFVLMRTHNLINELRYVFQEKSFATEAFYFSVILVLMILKSFQPEIFWGEKPMDFGLFNYLLRVDSLPPEDPWAVNHTMQYYYLGTFIAAMLTKLSGVSPGIGFNMSMVMVSTLTIMSVCAIFSSFTRHTFLYILGSIFFFLSSNFEVLRLWLQNKIKSFDLFWASSRVLHPPAFAEYPLWSFLFGDLHAHVIAYPFTLLLIGLGIAMVREWFSEERAAALPLAALYGAVLGSLFAINTWDCISYSLFSIPLFLSFFFGNEKREAWLTIQERLSLVFLRGVVAVAAMAAIIFPFYRTATSSVKLQWGSVFKEEFNSPEELFFFNGHWFILVFISSACLVGAAFARYRHKVSKARFGFVIACTLLPIFMSLYSRYRGADAMPWPGLSFAMAIIFLSTIPLIFPVRQARTLFFSVCGITAGLIFAGSEVFYLFDRMNTIFKFYSSLGSLLGVTAIGGLLLFIEGNQKRPQFMFRRLEVLIPPLLLVTPVFVLMLLASAINIEAMTTFKRIDQIVRPTLDGTAYLRKFAPEENALYQYINRNITGTPVLLEAQGISYAEFTRVQMNTGLPVILGWEHHVSQRGVSRRDIMKRKNVIREIYTSASLDRRLQLIRQYRVDLVVVGKLERENFPADELAKFDQPSSGFHKLFQSGKTVLYATPSSELNPLNQVKEGLEEE